MKPLSRLLAVTCCLATIAVPALRADEAPTAKPRARARLEPGARVTVGQPITVVVEVLVPTWFTGAPRFPDVEVAGALVVFEDRGINFSERIDGQSWAGQSRQYQIYPQRERAYEIEAIPILVRYNSPEAGSRTVATVSPAKLRFEATVPAEAAGLPYFISTTRLQLAQSLDPEPESMKVGDAFTRTLTVTVNDALSMVLPPLSSTPVPGLAAYPDPPRVTDTSGERGDRIIGTRVERTTFVAEEAGDYILPAIELAWWDVGAKRLRSAKLPALEFHVEANPNLAAELPLPPEDLAEEVAETSTGARVSVVEMLRRWVAPFAGLALVLFLASRLWRRFGPATLERFNEARRAHQESESAQFALFRRASRSGDALATWNRMTEWLDRAQPGHGPATIRSFVTASDDADLKADVDALDTALFAENSDARIGWSGTSLYKSVARIRRRRVRTRDADESIASLNPSR